ncbi:MAG: hypothetical protein HPY82_14040 [Gammaproteobacteria bacterium]|nr:hypothetical protein [Gammaproteobacteria bacterium]
MIKLRAVVGAVAGMALLFSSGVSALEISQVYSQTRQFDPAAGEQFKLHFTLDKTADVAVNFYDGRDLRVRQLRLGQRKAGSHHALWDGRDEQGRGIPPEAYVYTVIATAGNETVEHDLTDSTGGEHYVVKNITWDAARKELVYRLPSPSRINLRIGLEDNGPVLMTVRDWVARSSETQREQWDGWDMSHALDLSQHPRLLISGLAFTLSDNTVLVGPAAERVTLLDGLKEKRTVKKVSTPKVGYHQQQPLETRSDYQLQLAVPADLPRDAEGLPIVSGPLALRVNVDDPQRAISRRFEQILFVDGHYVQEAEMGFFPMTWHWDPAPLNEGIHYLTANVRGYEGNFGMATLKIRVKRTATASQEAKP